MRKILGGSKAVSEYFDKQTANSHYGAWDTEFEVEFDDMQMFQRPNIGFYIDELKNIFEVNCSDPNCNAVHVYNFVNKRYYKTWVKEFYEREDWARIFCFHNLWISGITNDWAIKVQQDGQRRKEMMRAGNDDNLPSMEASRDRFTKEDVATFDEMTGVMKHMLFASTQGRNSGVFDDDPRRNEFLYAYYEMMMHAHSFLDWGIHNEYAKRIYELLEELKLYDIRYAAITKKLCIINVKAGQQEIADNFSDISRTCCEELDISYTDLPV